MTVSNQLIVNDLSYLESVTQKAAIIGGQAVVNTQASASYGYASANADALALGKSTSTNTNTLASTKQYGNLYISYANATASAYAHTRNSTETAYSQSTALYIKVS